MDRLLLKSFPGRVGVLSNIDKIKCSSWRLLRVLCNNSPKAGGEIKNVTICSKCKTAIEHFSQKNFSVRQMKTFRQELRAVTSLLERSGFLHQRGLGIDGQFRHFSTSHLQCFEKEKKQVDRQHKKASSKKENDFNKKNENDEDEDDEDDEIKRLSKIYANLLVSIGTVLFLASLLSRSQSTAYITEDLLFKDVLLTGEVSKIQIKNDEALIELHPFAVINGQQMQFPYLRMKIADADKFEVKLREFEREAGIKIEDAIPVVWRNREFEDQFLALIWSLALLLVVMGGVVLIAGRALKNPTEQFKSAAKYIRGDIKFKESGGVSFKDVAGLKEAKVEIMEFVEFLKSPERFHALGAKVPHGSLLLGPPGCGKTLLAKAVATEANVPFLAMAGSEFIEMVGGLGASRVRDLFKEARKCAPCIVYIDEIDAIGKKRSSGMSTGGNSEGDQTLNQLLVEMDGMGTTEGVIVMGSTNIAHVLDKALLRPGRFDRHIMIDYPTMEERREMFEMSLNKLKLDESFKGDRHIMRLAQLSPGMTGADIANVCNEAALYAARMKKKTVDATDFEYAIERVTAGVAKRTSAISANEKKVIAYHESGHALVGWMLKHTDALLKISIVPRTSNMLGFAQYVPSDLKLISSDHLFERMCMALGGRAAESIIFDRITTGAQDDLRKVTKMAYDQIRVYGMNETIGQISFPDSATEFGQKPYSKMLANMIDREAQMLVMRAYKHSEKVLTDNKDKLHKLAHKLLEKETLMYADVEELMGPPPFGQKNILDLSSIKIATPTTEPDNGNNGNNGNNS